MLIFPWNISQPINIKASLQASYTKKTNFLVLVVESLTKTLDLQKIDKSHMC